jgi:hypothetical protein
MIVTNVVREIERTNVAEERSFTIKATGQAFRILSSGLYRDKIKAIIRELSCNAFDSHVAAGQNDRPFEIHLPNSVEPFFSVRDFGTGLSHNDVMTIYTTYFESTKRHSNSFIGEKGLGSKSPFSYVDAFTVISHYNGEKRSYGAYIGEDGTPEINLLDTSTTDEPNGLEVSLPVLRNFDHVDFRIRAREVLSYFSPLPVVKGYTEFDFHVHTPIFEGNDWRIVKPMSYGVEQSAQAVMGNVIYPIDYRSIPPSQITERERDLLRCQIEIKFDIGDLDVTAGREDLSYDNPTVATLVTKTREILAEMVHTVQGKFNECASEYDARAMYGSLFNNSSRIAPLLRGEEFFFRGMLLSSNSFALPLSEYDGMLVTCWSQQNRRRTVNRYLTRDETLFLPASTDTVVVVNDVPRGGLGRARWYRRNLLKRESLFLIQFSKPGIREAVLKQLDGLPIQYTSDLEKPPIVRGERAVANVMLYNASGNNGKGFWSQLNEDITDDGIYVPLRRGLPQLGDSVDANFGRMIEAATAIDIFSGQEAIEIHGIPAASTKKLGEGWCLLQDVLRERFELTLQLPMTMAALRAEYLAIAVSDLVGGSQYVLRELKFVADAIGPSHPLHRVYWEMDAVTQKTTKAAHYRNLASFLGVHIPPIDFEKELSDWRETLTQYPLLFAALRHGVKITAVMDYINLIDTSNARELALAA